MDKAFLRYSRQIFMEEIGVQGQRKINAAKVLVVGAGGLGSPIIQYLAAAGIGCLGVVDFDVLEIHNLNRQTIYSENGIGKPKVENASVFVKALNSCITFIPIEGKVTAENAEEIICPWDIVLDGSDNFATRYIVNDTCVALNKPLVYGSIFAHEGRVAVFNYEGSKNLRHLFPEPPNEEVLPDCDRFGVLGALPGIIGSIMAMHALQMILGFEVMTNQLQLLDTNNWDFRKLGF